LRIFPERLLTKISKKNLEKYYNRGEELIRKEIKKRQAEEEVKE
jgi:hypothetical protein